jgi:hypothetical protein
MVLLLARRPAHIRPREDTDIPNRDDFTPDRARAKVNLPPRNRQLSLHDRGATTGVSTANAKDATCPLPNNAVALGLTKVI